jgi:hypothetical protein
VRLSVPRGVRLKGRRTVVVRRKAASRVVIAGRLNHRVRKRRTFVLEALDATGRVVRQRLKARG